MKSFSKILLPLLLALLLVALSACGQKAPAASGDMGEIVVTAGDAADYGKIAPFTTKDTEGNEVTEAVFAEANVTMLNVWATFCGFCIQEMPDLTKLNGEFADQGFQILGLVGDVGDGAGGFTTEDMAEAQAIMDDAGAKFPTLMPASALIASVMPNVPGYPTTFFVDAEGNLLGEPVVGARGEEFWRGTIEAYLAAVPAQEAQE